MQVKVALMIIIGMITIIRIPTRNLNSAFGHAHN